ncbi:hypothetical protein DBR32_05095 [Taibaiella sp. KBW10]|uniref:DUF5034 domain-containing protein n=1 Tax=Taibaiella sp. KBW10 TaxID=2153357 RepID=UPI000F5A968A|nr:DUF5034 domain-containing protein [Taibaiella sp. KBW10]RQO31342.1 hypothetical protein DBR32_05095 [Taibaiella sp. KBW10]
MKKLSLTLLSFTGLTFLVWLCSLASCRQQSYNVILKDIKLNTYRLLPPASTDQDTVLLPQGVSVMIDSFMLRFETSTYTYLVKSAPMPALGNTAYALTIAPDNYNHIDKITDVKIFTLNNYNSSYPAGADITAICNFHYYNLRTLSDPITLSALLENVYGDNRIDPVSSFQFGIAIRQNPDLDNAVHQFRAEIRTDKGGIFIDTTTSFRIKR